MEDIKCELCGSEDILPDENGVFKHAKDSQGNYYLCQHCVFIHLNEDHVDSYTHIARFLISTVKRRFPSLKDWASLESKLAVHISDGNDSGNIEVMDPSEFVGEKLNELLLCDCENCKKFQIGGFYYDIFSIVENFELRIKDFKNLPFGPHELRDQVMTSVLSSLWDSSYVWPSIISNVEVETGHGPNVLLKFIVEFLLVVPNLSGSRTIDIDFSEDEEE